MDHSKYLKSTDMMLFNSFEPLELVRETAEMAPDTVEDGIHSIPFTPLDLMKETTETMEDAMEDETLIFSNLEPVEEEEMPIPVKRWQFIKSDAIKRQQNSNDLGEKIRERSKIQMTFSALFKAFASALPLRRTSEEKYVTIAVGEKRAENTQDDLFQGLPKSIRSLARVHLSLPSLKESECFGSSIGNLTLLKTLHLIKTINSPWQCHIRNLEDYLHKDCVSHLTADDRIRIISELNKAIMKLHSSDILHGNLKPENILISSDFQCILTGAGKGLLQEQDHVGDTIFFNEMFPNGTYSYVDPEYMITGKITQLSDVYSFGVIMLRMLTGKSPVGIVSAVKEALKRESLEEILDKSAGEWPLKEVEQLAKIAIKCCEILGENRPALTEVLNVLQTMEIASTHSSVPYSGSKLASVDITPPSYFICPILQDVMTDPAIAADGYTYECEAIKKWLESGHTTSPMTNLELPNNDLIPNRALRSAIKEWTVKVNNWSEP